MTNDVSAEAMFHHMSDEFLAEIEDDIAEFVAEEMLAEQYAD